MNGVLCFKTASPKVGRLAARFQVANEESLLWLLRWKSSSPYPENSMLRLTVWGSLWLRVCEKLGIVILYVLLGQLLPKTVCQIPVSPGVWLLLKQSLVA